jgi:type IV fimbrial biogenesis protein FimT
MSTGKHQSGFTIVELLVTLIVAAIVMTMAAPSFRNFVANSRLTTVTNDFVTAISFARSEAVKRSSNVRVVAISPSSANEWGGGWQVVDNGGNIIRIFQPSSGTVTMDDSGDVTTLTFDSRGFLSGLAAGTAISICDNRDEETGRQLTISPTGRPQLNRTFTCT